VLPEHSQIAVSQSSVRFALIELFEAHAQGSCEVCLCVWKGGDVVVSSDGWLALQAMTLDGDHGPEPPTEMISSLTHSEFITLANVDTYPFGTMSSSVTRL
jgi:hypothetical protein